jgi:nucleotide-binding universal stress UspA family protein
MATIIVSYDGTPNDDDALALGRLFASAGAQLELAYVRHQQEYDPQREQLAQHDAERLLERGAELLGTPEIPRHVILSGSTGEGLAKLAEAEGAAAVAFGSDYRTAPGHVEPGTSAQRMLAGGPVAVAVAPAGLRANGTAALASIALEGDDDAARATAASLAAAVGGTVSADGGDLLIVGSQPGAPAGRLALPGAARSRIERSRCPVLVLPAATSIDF